MIFIVFFFLFQSSHSSNFISKSCKEASKINPPLSYDFCVAALEETSSNLQPPPTTLEDLVGISVQLAKSNGTNVLSIISKLLKDKSFDQYTKGCLQSCSDFYLQSLKFLDDAIVAFKSKNFSQAADILSYATTQCVMCDDSFEERKTKSPLKTENQVYWELDIISLTFVNMLRQHRKA